MPVIVVSHVVLVYDLDPAQPFDVENALEAGNEQAQRIALLGTHRLAVHAVT